MPFSEDPASRVRALVREKPLSLMTDELPPVKELNREVDIFGGVSITADERKQEAQRKRLARQDLNRAMNRSRTEAEQRAGAR